MKKYVRLTFQYQPYYFQSKFMGTSQVSRIICGSYDTWFRGCSGVRIADSQALLHLTGPYKALFLGRAQFSGQRLRQVSSRTWHDAIRDLGLMRYRASTPPPVQELLCSRHEATETAQRGRVTFWRCPLMHAYILLREYEIARMDVIRQLCYVLSVGSRHP